MTPKIKNKIEQIRRGNVPEGYKRSAAGIIPIEWECKSIGSCLKVKNNERKPISEEIRSTIPGPYPYYGPTQAQGFISTYESEGPAVLIGEDGDHFLKYKTKSMTLWIDGKYTVNNHAHMICGTDECTAKWFYYAYQFKPLLNAITRQGAGRYKLTKEALEKLPVQIPTRAEQEKIAKILTLQDKVIELEEQKIEELKKAKKYFLNKMFPQKGQAVPEIRFKGFTDAWEQRKVSEVAEIVAGGTPSTAIDKYWNPKEVPWLSSGEVHKKYITCTDNMISWEGMNNSSAKMIEENSVLIALAGQGKTRGTVAINRIPVTTNQSIAAMTFNDEIIPEFVLCNLENRYDEIRKISSGDGSRGGLNKQLIGDIVIPFTSKEEQKKIGECFCNLDNLITLHQRKLEEEKQKKKALMQLLLTGIVRVNV